MKGPELSKETINLVFFTLILILISGLAKSTFGLFPYEDLNESTIASFVFKAVYIL